MLNAGILFGVHAHVSCSNVLLCVGGGVGVGCQALISALLSSFIVVDCSLPPPQFLLAGSGFLMTWQGWSFFISQQVLGIVAQLPNEASKGQMLNSLRTACLEEQDYMFCDCPGWLRMAQDKIAEDGSGDPVTLHPRSPRMAQDCPG